MDFDGSDHDEGELRNGDHNNSTREEGPGPACQACRRKKAKCSRKTPCSQCVKADITCLYDKDKAKPGMKAGAIDRLTRRLDNLENMFLGQGVLWQAIWNSLTESHGPANVSTQKTTSILECTQQLQDTLHSLGRKRLAEDVSGSMTTEPKKRQRVESNTLHPDSLFSLTDDGTLPIDLQDSLVDIYFERLHPWIPILHVRETRRRMGVTEERLKLDTVLRAITSVTVRFSNDARLDNAEARARLARINRQLVVSRSMESFSVENLQALIICAFDTIGSGRGPSAWSIVGSMARTVEQLQLSIEDEGNCSTTNTQALVRRLHFLPPCTSWVEVEERRRVFWNIFLMDRFCSIATGWNVCLTNADVKRRLPCEGAFWEEGRALDVPTPYFGVSDPPGSTRLPNARPEEADQASLGGFAYCIEATESLSLVTSFFLQQAVDVAKTHDVQLWLMRFKQLDLRLIQWKIFLPERWREACALNDDGNMDPNLTLAHITHNTAVVLLHQGIAYPSPEWRSLPINLPSASSAKTCMTAAMEVSIIANEFLRNNQCLTNPQFAFCLFICGRMLIAHSAYYNVPLSEAFDNLISNLGEMARRWNGEDSTSSVSNLASKFALRLHKARQIGDQTLDIRQAAYSEDQFEAPCGHDRASSNPTQMLDAFGEVPPAATEQWDTPDSITLAFPPLPLAFQAPSASRIPTALPSPNTDFLNYASLGHGSQEIDHVNGGQPAMAPEVAFDKNGNVSLEHLTSLLDYSTLPDQRVSAFSS